MKSTQTALERAFEMARSGQFANVATLADALSREGYMRNQVEGRELRRQLSDLIKAAKPAD